MMYKKETFLYLGKKTLKFKNIITNKFIDAKRFTDLFFTIRDQCDYFLLNIRCITHEHKLENILKLKLTYNE